MNFKINFKQIIFKMNNKEIEKIINRNNLIEQNIINQESGLLEKNIISQTKKISPFIEIIDSSRFDENILSSNENFVDIQNIEDKGTLEKKESINSIPNNNINNNNNEEPMTFNPNKKNNYMDNIIKKENKSADNENSSLIDVMNIKEKGYESKFNEDIINLDELIIMIKKLIDKMKYNLEKNKECKINNIFVDKIKKIKNDVICVFDNAIKEETLKLNEISVDETNIRTFNKNNFLESQFEIKNNNNNFSSVKVNKIDEIEYIYKIQIINLRKKIIFFEKENSNLKKILENSKNILEDLIYKNKLLSSKLIKYKALYENRKDI